MITLHELSRLESWDSQQWDEALLLAKSGDADALELFIRETSAYLWMHAARWIRSGLDIDDARSFIGEAVARCLREYRPEGGLRTWISKIFHRRIIDKWYRPRKDVLSRPNRGELNFIDAADCEILELGQASISSPERELLLAAFEAQVKEFAATLKQDDATVFEMLIQGYPPAEISQVLPDRSIKDITYRVRRSFEAFLSKG